MTHTIKITECYGERLTTTTAHRSADTDAAVERAIAKRYGRNAWFAESRSMRVEGARYGQVFRPIRGTRTMTGITGHIEVATS